MNGLKPYMGYSNMAGSAEGAILIFAHSIKEAKKIGWRGMPGDICDVFTDIWKAEIFAWWDKPVTNAYTEALAGLVKLTNHIGRGYSFKVIRAKLLYSNLPTFHRPVFDRSLEQRPPFVPLGEMKDYGVKFSTLYKMMEE